MSLALYCIDIGIRHLNLLLVSRKVGESKLCLVYEPLIRDLRGFVNLLHKIPDTKSHCAASRSSSKFRNDKMFYERFLHEPPCFRIGAILSYYVYILASKRDGVLYTGVTSDLPRRIWEHKNQLAPGFSHKYNTQQLVYFEIHTEIEQAILKEKQIKKWKRSWKIALIEKSNPDWKDLYNDIIE